MKNRYWILLTLSLLIACSPQFGGSGRDFPTHLMMNSQDLPPNWELSLFNEMNVENAESYIIEFTDSKGTTKPLLVQHQLSVYINVDAAKDAYPDWEKQWMPTTDWVTPDKFDFQPRVETDLFRLACMSNKVNGQPILFCHYLQQHNNMIALVLAQLDDENLNLQQLINAIEILDVRLQQD